ncbi:YdcF family protein [Mucilaginibacter pedocola]|nr:YdcF family protein [Mucilaginibacter pedocola]
MYFILSKVLYILILPFLWIFGMLVYAIFTKKPKRARKLLITSVIILYFFGNPIPMRLYSNMWDIKAYNPGNNKFSSIILLGGFVSEDATGHGFFNNAADRYTEAVKLLQNGTASHLLVTGGNGNLNPSGFREGTFVQGELRKLGIPDSAVLIESNARNTFENAAFSKAILQKTTLKPPYLLVTSAFHMRRSLLIFKKAGIPVVAYPCDYYKTNRGAISFWDLLPDTVVYGTWNTYIKELIGYIVALLK